MKFEQTLLGDFADIQGGYAFKSKDLQSESFCPVVKIKNVRDGFLSIDDVTYVSEEIVSETKRFLCKEGDVLISMTGSGPNAPESMVGRVARVKNADLPALINQRVGRLLIRDEKSISQKFLYYCLSSKSARDYLVSSSTGSANQANISADTIKSLKIPKISFLESVEVGKLLSKFDDKIELNQKMNHTLEEIAKAIFKSWFVDFDPVRAKAEGRPTGLPPEISDLFPDELVDSEIGEIPKGWEVSPLSEFTMEVGKKTKPSQETEQRPYVPIDCISSKSLTLWEFKNGEEAKSSLVSFKKGDILFGAMRPYFHKVCIAPFDGTTRTTCLVLSSKARDYFGFSLLTLFLDSTIDFATQNSTGSTIPYIKWKNELETLTVSLPPVELARQFNKFLEPILAKFLMSIEEQKVLSELRDTLLPKLISGELRIPDAEKFLEEAGI